MGGGWVQRRVPSVSWGTTSYYDNRGNSGTAQGYSTSRTVTVTPSTGNALPVVPDVYLVPGGYPPDAPYGPTR